MKRPVAIVVCALSLPGLARAQVGSPPPAPPLDLGVQALFSFPELPPLPPPPPWLPPVPTPGQVFEEGKKAAGDVVTTTTNAAGDAIETVKTASGDVTKTVTQASGDVTRTVSTAAGDVTRTVQRAGGDVLTVTQKAGGDVVRETQHTGGDVVRTTVTASGDIVTTLSSAGKDVLTTTEHTTGDIIRSTQYASGDVIETARKGTGDFVTTVQTAGGDVIKVEENAHGDLVTTIKKAQGDVTTTIVKAGSDIYAEHGRALVNVADAGKALVKYQQAQIEGLGSSIGSAERRVREGKIVDALWGLGVEPLQDTDKNAAKALQESTLLATVAQVAASTYGGPAGAAAYAAWYTYKQTGDADLAFRVGVITGASSLASGAAGKLPNGTALEISKKAIVTGVIGGLAAAAVGGDEQAMRDAALMAASASLVQDGYKKYTTHDLNPESSRGEGYCMRVTTATMNSECAPPDTAYKRDGSGKIIEDPVTGELEVDVKKTDPSRPHVGKWSNESGNPRLVGERSGAMTAVSRVPGMNAMSLLHDEFAVSWKLGDVATVASIPPAIVITYIGTGAPYYMHLEQTAVAKWQRANSPVTPVALPYDPKKSIVVTGTDGGRSPPKVKPPKLPTTLLTKPPLTGSSYEERSYLCITTKEPRMVIVERPRGPSDFACKVQYVKDGAMTTPWVARNEKGYCGPKAKVLADKLTGAFSCLYRGPN